MSLRRETLPSTSSLDRSPLPGSHKVYVPGPGGMRVPFREIGLSPTRGLRGETEMNPPFRVYDTSGPYTDPAVPIDLEARPAGAPPSLDPGARSVRGGDAPPDRTRRPSPSTSRGRGRSCAGGAR